MLLTLLTAANAAVASPKMVDMYSRTRTLPRKMPLPTPYVELSPRFSFTFAVEELPEENCPPCPKCQECPGCPKCHQCPECPPPPRCEVCVVCPTPCPECAPCPPCPDGKVEAQDDANGPGSRILFFEFV